MRAHRAFLRIRRAALVSACAATVAAGCVPGSSHARQVRRLSAGLSPACYFFDASYWGIEGGCGADLVLRCEIANNLFVENRLGGYGASQDGAGITGFNGQIGIIHFLPYWIPNRPSFRAGFALMTVNPVISDPVETFRPSQTVLYFVTGLGITRSLREYLQLELGVDLLVTPFRYRVYHFYRQYVDAGEERFLHGAVTIGASYTF
ncbi:MAG: hypothetical protein PHQ19_04985 [Candidatus Krumholzibacteria bacterium]|nr:hypothetical protein [Candidatus Krumholzibacteria bacterium]